MIEEVVSLAALMEREPGSRETRKRILAAEGQEILSVTARMGELSGSQEPGNSTGHSKQQLTALLLGKVSPT